MTKQWYAAIMLLSQVLIVAWLIYDGATAPPPEGVAAVAGKLLWAGLAMIVFNIVAAIAVAIAGGIVTRKEFKDERSDERDRAVYNKSMRNAYFVVSAGGITTLLLLAFGHDGATAAWAVFTGGMLAGATGSLSQLYYYRVG